MYVVLSQKGGERKGFDESSMLPAQLLVLVALHGH